MVASVHTVIVIRNVYDARYLPQRNACMTYCLFSAALVVLANEFAELHVNAKADEIITTAIEIMGYCGELSPQPARLVQILQYFWVDVQQQRHKRSQQRTMSESRQQNVVSPFATEQTLTGKNQFFEQQQQPKQMPLDHSSSLQVHSILLQDPGAMYAASQPGYDQHGQALQYNTPSATGESQQRQRQQQQAQHSQQQRQQQSPAEHALRDRSNSFSNLLDLPDFDNLVFQQGAGSNEDVESFDVDDQIDLDALWAWPSDGGDDNDHSRILSGLYSEKDIAGNSLVDIQGISDSRIPLFGFNLGTDGAV